MFAVVSTTSYNSALRALDEGDAASLETMLRNDPDLVRARCETKEPPYDGYFGGSTLLHHTVGNPSRQPLPANVVSMIRLLLDYGADVDAATQFGNWSWTALGLAVTSSALVATNIDLAVIDTLLEYGADADWNNGMNLFGALFHVAEDPRLLRCARYLALRGASLDLAFAAGVGSIETVRQYLSMPTLSPSAYRLYRHPDRWMAIHNEQQIFDEALAFAALCGQTECARLLLERGASIDSWTAFGRLSATPLHWAAYTGWPDTVSFLVARGARTDVVDPNYQSTPLGWAKHANRAVVVGLLE